MCIFSSAPRIWDVRSRSRNSKKSPCILGRNPFRLGRCVKKNISHARMHGLRVGKPFALRCFFFLSAAGSRVVRTGSRAVRCTDCAILVGAVTCDSRAGHRIERHANKSQVLCEGNSGKVSPHRPSACPEAQGTAPTARTPTATVAYRCLWAA